MIGSAGLRWYRTGTVNITQGSATVTGVGSQWQIAGIKPGDVFSLDSSIWYEVISVEGNTSLTLDTAFQGASGNAQNYKIIRNFAATMQAEIAARVANLVNKYESFIDAELQKLVGPKGDPGIMYKGAWAAGRSYQALDTVTHTDKVYLSRMPHTSTSNNAPGAAGSAWMEFALTAPPILNTLDSDRTDAALSAAQGKALNQNCIKYSSGTVIIWIAPDGDDTVGQGTETAPYKTISKALNIASRIVDVAVDIVLKPGEYLGPQLSLFWMAMPHLTFRSSTKNKTDVIVKSTNDTVFNIFACSSSISLSNLTLKANATTNSICVKALSIPSVVIVSCDMSECDVGVWASRCNCIVSDTNIITNTSCLRADRACVMSTTNITGTGKYGITSNGGIVFSNTEKPTGTVTNEVKTHGGQIFTG